MLQRFFNRSVNPAGRQNASFYRISRDARLLGGGRIFAPHARQGGLDFFLEAGDQFAIGGDQRLLGFDFGDYGLLRGEGWEGNLDRLNIDKMKVRNRTGLGAGDILSRILMRLTLPNMSIVITSAPCLKSKQVD